VAPLVHDVPQPGPCTHALVIGVGRYAHLPGGKGTQLPDPQGLGQLTSPPESARAFAHWLISSHVDPDHPLATVRLLVSEAGNGRAFVNASTQVQHQLDPANIDTIEAAVGEWKAAGDQRPDNVLLFFFCGHGLGNGSVLALLAEDFGAKPNNPLDGAIDFAAFRAGMNRCAAQQQVYFVDACRSLAEILQFGGGVVGRPLVLPSVLAKKKLQPTYHSTLIGEQAHGEVKKPSHFTKALLAGLAGTATDKHAGTWRVTTTRLQDAIQTHLARNGHPPFAPADDLSRFLLNAIPDPQVPVFVECDPADGRAVSSLEVLRANQVVNQCAAPAPKPWLLSLSAGRVYSFRARPQAPWKDVTRDEEAVIPPETIVPLRVSQ
jgi:hypothetical protein